MLSGGRGTRLMQLTDWRCKPAVPFGGKFRIIDFTLSNCVNSGIRRIGVATQYKAQSLIRHLQRGWSFLDGRFQEFVDILPAQQQVAENWYRGTADAVFQNLDALRRNRPRFALILAGDHIYKMDYGKHAGPACRQQARRRPDRGLHRRAAAPRTPALYGVVGVDDNDLRSARLRRKAGRPAGDLYPMQARPRARQHGRLCVQCRRFPLPSS